MSYQKSTRSNLRNDGYDPLNAFKQRRQIYLSVQEMQSLEHDVIKRIGDITMTKKKELLEILSSWLLDKTTIGPEISDAESLSGCKMDEWLILQAKVESLQTEINRCTHVAQVAESAYNSAAPLGTIGLGIINEWIADSSNKTKILSLATEARTRATERDEAVNRLATNVRERQLFGKRFLRGCLSNIQRLGTSNVFGARARNIVGEITQGVETEWLNHIRAIEHGLTYLDDNLNILRQIYGIGDH